MAKNIEPLIQKIGKYVVIDVIGSGGMGVVYRARDAALNRTVAIKMLKRADAGDAQGLQLEKFFNRELRATGSLQHKNIVTVYESGEQDGNPYFVMECLEGEPVSRIIAERRSMAIVDKLDLLVQVCDGLQYAHDRKPQVIHRDIKPANIILLNDGTAKIVDFGIARVVGSESSVLQTGQLVGSLSYMSPEQINSIPIDARTDIFSAGVMLYELLTYTLPFKGSDAGATFVKILREDPEPLSSYLEDVPGELQGCVNRSLAKKMHDRYQTAEEFGFDLLQIQKKIKQGMTADFMQRAEAAMHRGDLERVKLHLQEIIRLDRQHERANRLLAEVRKAIQQQQRGAQIIQMRSQAQVALAGQQYEEALACAEQAVQLNPEDQSSVALREEIRNAIALGKAVRDALRRAESALYAGDFDEAREAVEGALRLDPSGSEARALAAIIDKELAERSRRLQVQGLVDSARHGISQRQFGDAIESLRKAEELDPSDSNVRELLQWASRGQEQEQRRKDLLDVTDQIDSALRAEDFSSAYTICEVGLGRFPNEPTLIRLKSIAEKQKDVAARRRFVQEQSLAVRELLRRAQYGPAIEMLEAALGRFPAEPNLEALLSLARKETQQDSRSREELAAKQESDRTSIWNHQQAQQQVAECATGLRKALDDREDIAGLERIGSKLKQLMASVELDQRTREICDPMLEEVQARRHARELAFSELQQIRKIVEESSEGSARVQAGERLLVFKATFPHDAEIRGACEDVVKVLDARKDERRKIVAELTRIAESVKQGPLEESENLLRHSTHISARVTADPQVGALLQQIKYEIDRRLERRQAKVQEIEQLENAASNAQSLSALSQLVEQAYAVASSDAEEREVVASLDRLQLATDLRRRTIMSLIREIEQITDKAAVARTIEGAEELASEAERKASAHPDIADIQEMLLRITAQVRGRRVEHDLVYQELVTLDSSVGDALMVADLDQIRQRAVELNGSHPGDTAISTLCKQLEVDVRTARARLLRIEVDRQRQESEDRAGKQQIETAEIALSIRKLQDLVKSFPESMELRSMLLKAQENLQSSERARHEADARRTAIDLEVRTCSKLMQPGRFSKALNALEEAAANYPESEQLRSMLAKCRDESAREQETQRAASTRKAAIQAAIDKGTDLLNRHRSDEALALLELACQQWADEKDLARLLSAARRSSKRERAEDEKNVQSQPDGKAASLTGTLLSGVGSKRPARKTVVLVFVVIVTAIISTYFYRRYTSHLPQPSLTMLGVETSPSGAEVQINGSKCKTPGCSFKLSPGTYRVQTTLAGYQNGMQVITLKKDEASSSLFVDMVKVATNKLPPLSDRAHLTVQGARPGSRFFIDDAEVGRIDKQGSFERDVEAGTHRLKMMAGNQELLANPRQFKPDTVTAFNSADFKAPASGTSKELLDWQSLQNSQDIGALEQFLRHYPNTSFRSPAESRLEDLNWSRASKSDTLQGLHEYVAKYSSPAGPHLHDAQSEIARLEWQSIQNTTDTLQLEAFAVRNSQGPYHDLAVSQLDDLTWKLADRTDDAASLGHYLKRYPAGKHADEARKGLARLNLEKVPTIKPGDGSVPVGNVGPPVGNGDSAILKLLVSYKLAYETENVGNLQKIWPSMSSSQVSGLRSYFQNADALKLTYGITNGPTISGNVASVGFTQQLDFADKKTHESKTFKTKVTMKLKKAGVSGMDDWQIDSIK